MRDTLLRAAIFAAAASLAACGGGGGTSGAGGYGGPPVVTPTKAPSSNPSSAPGSQSAGDAKQAQINGAPALVDASSGLALYTFDGDTTANQSNCTGGCLAIWPAHAANSSESNTGNFTIFKRGDNGSLQWAYKGKPLYTFVSDTPTNNGTGDNVQGFHIARP